MAQISGAKTSGKARLSIPAAPPGSHRGMPASSVKVTRIAPGPASRIRAQRRGGRAAIVSIELRIGAEYGDNVAIASRMLLRILINNIGAALIDCTDMTGWEMTKLIVAASMVSALVSQTAWAQESET